MSSITCDPTGGRPSDHKGGFALVEVLVASVILLVIALGLIPLYTRSMQNNQQGFDYTKVSNFAKSRAEQYLQLPFDDPLLTVAGGTTETAVDDFYSQQKEEWVPGLGSGDLALFTRTTTVRQFSIGDLTTPLDGNALPEAVHLKEITVSVRGNRAAVSGFGPGKTIAVRVFKSQ